MATKWYALFVVATLPALLTAQPDRLRMPDNSGWLGVAFVVESDKSRIVITDMQPDGPAAQAKLKSGDVVLRVGNAEPKNAQQFTDEVAKHRAGDKLTLTVIRDGKEQKIDVTLGKRPNVRLNPPSQ